MIDCRFHQIQLDVMSSWVILGSNRSCRKGLKAFGTSEGLLLKDSRFPGSHDAAAPMARSIETLGFGFSEMMVWWMQKTSKYVNKHSKPSVDGCDFDPFPVVRHDFSWNLGRQVFSMLESRDTWTRENPMLQHLAMFSKNQCHSTPDVYHDSPIQSC